MTKCITKYNKYDIFPFGSVQTFFFFYYVCLRYSDAAHIWHQNISKSILVGSLLGLDFTCPLNHFMWENFTKRQGNRGGFYSQTRCSSLTSVQMSMCGGLADHQQERYQMSAEVCGLTSGCYKQQRIYTKY